MESDSTSLGRGLQLLAALAPNDGEPGAGGRGVVELARALGREKSQVSRALKTLAEHGFVDRDPETLDYRLGWRLFALAAQAGNGRLLAVAPGVLRSLVASLGETAHLSVLDGGEVLTVASESSPSSVRASDFVGRRVPTYCTASGRALLIDHDAAALKVLLGAGRLPPAGPDAPDSAVELARRIDSAREPGFAVAQEELEPGLVAVAAPVRDFRGAVVAALNVSAPQFRFQARLPAAGEQTRQAADQLSHELGYRPQASRPSPNAHPTPIPRRAS